MYIDFSIFSTIFPFYISIIKLSIDILFLCLFVIFAFLFAFSCCIFYLCIFVMDAHLWPHCAGHYRVKPTTSAPPHIPIYKSTPAVLHLPTSDNRQTYFNWFRCLNVWCEIIKKKFSLKKVKKRKIKCKKLYKFMWLHVKGKTRWRTSRETRVIYAQLVGVCVSMCVCACRCRCVCLGGC